MGNVADSFVLPAICIALARNQSAGSCGCAGRMTGVRVYLRQPNPAVHLQLLRRERMHPIGQHLARPCPRAVEDGSEEGAAQALAKCALVPAAVSLLMYALQPAAAEADSQVPRHVPDEPWNLCTRANSSPRPLKRVLCHSHEGTLLAHNLFIGPDVTTTNECP